MGHDLKNNRRRATLTRRQFLKRAAAGGAALVAAGCGVDGLVTPATGRGASRALGSATGPLIFIALDGLHPGYLALNRYGHPGGKPGNFLMENLRKFLAGAAWYPQARCFLPSATDMNHMNALAGTHSGEHGILSVNSQIMGWGDDGNPLRGSTHISWLRDGQGRPVDTLFHAFKRTRPDCVTAFISGKEWVAEMFRQQDPVLVDYIVTGATWSQFGFLEKPVRVSFTDPPSDQDARCDPESGLQKNWLTAFMEYRTEHCPPDAWVVDSTLRLFEQASPDMAYVLLAQADDTGHALGAGWNPEEFRKATNPYSPPSLCLNLPRYQLVSGRDERVYREPILDSVREIDFQFGRLIDGLTQQGVLQNATVMVLSDHSMVTHLRSRMIRPTETDMYRLLLDAGLVDEGTVVVHGGCSSGAVYWRPDAKDPARIAKAKEFLLAHRAINPETGQGECPWMIGDRQDMLRGIAGFSGPGELYHRYFIDVDREQSLVWPDLVVGMLNGWQLPAGLNNLGIDTGTLAANLMVGGHGSIDTLPIVLGMRLPGGAARVSDQPARIADLAVTAASLYGLQMQSNQVGTDRSGEL